MRKLFIALFIVLMSSAVVFGYSYEGKYDPGDFFGWDVINMGKCPNNHIHVYIQDPDSDVKVESINVVLADETWRIIAYVYIEDGIKYTFMLDPHTGNYIQVDPLPKSKHGI